MVALISKIRVSGWFFAETLIIARLKELLTRLIIKKYAAAGLFSTKYIHVPKYSPPKCRES